MDSTKRRLELSPGCHYIHKNKPFWDALIKCITTVPGIVDYYDANTVFKLIPEDANRHHLWVHVTEDSEYPIDAFAIVSINGQQGQILWGYHTDNDSWGKLSDFFEEWLFQSGATNIDANYRVPRAEANLAPSVLKNEMRRLQLMLQMQNRGYYLLRLIRKHWYNKHTMRTLSKLRNPEPDGYVNESQFSFLREGLSGQDHENGIQSELMIWLRDSMLAILGENMYEFVNIPGIRTLPGHPELARFATLHFPEYGTMQGIAGILFLNREQLPDGSWTPGTAMTFLKDNSCTQSWVFESFAQSSALTSIFTNLDVFQNAPSGMIHYRDAWDNDSFIKIGEMFRHSHPTPTEREPRSSFEEKYGKDFAICYSTVQRSDTPNCLFAYFFITPLSLDVTYHDKCIPDLASKVAKCLKSLQMSKSPSVEEPAFKQICANLSTFSKLQPHILSPEPEEQVYIEAQLAANVVWDAYCDTAKQERYSHLN